MSGQITPDSVFGQLLTKYAQDAETIVELGTFTGEGSTLCLHQILRLNAVIYTVEIDPEMFQRAKDGWGDVGNIVFLCGRVSETFDDYEHPGGESMRKTLGYDFCRDQFFKAPKVLDQLPAKIDTLLIDAGEFSATGELDALMDRCTGVIALDDTNPTVAHKNVRNRELLLKLGWTVLHDAPEDRNGFAIFRSP